MCVGEGRGAAALVVVGLGAFERLPLERCELGFEGLDTTLELSDALGKVELGEGVLDLEPTIFESVADRFGRLRLAMNGRRRRDGRLEGG